MSQPQPDDKFDLGGKSLREWSFIILMLNLTVVIVIFSIAFAVAMFNNPDIIITGSIDIGQFVGIIIGIAIVATTLVAQQLTKNQITSAIRDADEVWLKTEKP